jgi:uncharacterized protein (TIGR02453 family)
MAARSKAARASEEEFHGFPPEFFTFYAGLEQDNSKDYWEAHKDIWEDAVQRPTQQLISELEGRWGPLRAFRPQQDVRFSKEKLPYKTWVGITTSSKAVGGVGYFARIESTGMRIAAGAMVMAPDQIERFRAAVLHDSYGAEFERIAKRLKSKSLPVCSGRAPELKRIPSAYDAEHPRAEYLRWKGAVVIREYDLASWMHTRHALNRVADVWSAAQPLTDWIERHVGQSEEPMRQRGGARKSA